MAQQQRVVTLNNGKQMPRIGLGTYQTGGEDVKRAIRHALELGIRHIDTASIYRNEEDIADELKSCKIDRKDLFITSKLSPYEQGAGRAMKAFEAMLQRLGTDYLDLLLIHWPGVSGQAPSDSSNADKRLETWRTMEQLYLEGHVKAIGVSNYETSHIAELLGNATVKPMVNQIEVHPRYQNSDVRKLCEQNGIAVVAYASLGRGQLIPDPVVVSIAKEVQKTPAQVLLRYGLDKGCLVIPKSITPSRIEEFREEELLTWSLDPAQIARLDALQDGHKFCWDPAVVA